MIYNPGKGKQNPFILSVSTTTANLNNANTMYYFAGHGASYSNSSSDRPIPILQPAIIKQAVYILQHATPATVQATNITGYVINTTQSSTGIIFTTPTSNIDNAFYKYTNNNLNIPCNQGDNIVCAIFNTAASVTNLRSMVYLYCY